MNVRIPRKPKAQTVEQRINSLPAGENRLYLKKIYDSIDRLVAWSGNEASSVGWPSWMLDEARHLENTAGVYHAFRLANMEGKK